MRILTLVAAATLLGFPSTTFAQATGTGTVVGRISDSSGAVLPGVTVSLRSSEALGQFSGTTDADGTYRVTNLPPATYEVKAELSGFQTAISKVSVRLASTLTVDFTLSLGSLTDTVVVTGEAPIVDRERTGLAVNINNEALTSLPVSTQRRYQDIWALVPGVYVRPDQSDINPSVNSRGTSENSTASRRHGRHRPVRRRRILGRLQLRRDPGCADQDAGRRSRGRRTHRRVHEHHDQERQQSAARLGGVLRHSRRVQQLERGGRRRQPAHGRAARLHARRADRRRQSLVLRRLSPHLRGPDAQQRAGPARAARQPDLRENHVADQRRASPLGLGAVRQDAGEERGHPQLADRRQLGDGGAVERDAAARRSRRRSAIS